MNHALTLALATSLTIGTALPEERSAPLLVETKGALCQLNFTGSVGKEPVEWVSVSVTHLVENEAVETSLTAQVKSGTGAGSLSALLAMRLRAQGASVTAVDIGILQGELFIEDVVSVRLDLPAGPEASVTFCDRPLGVLALRPTSAAPGAGKLEFLGVVKSINGKHRSHEALSVPVVEGDSGHDVCKRLFDQSLEAGWLPVRPETDRWSPSRRKDARKLESAEVKLSASGWELEVFAA